MPELVLYGIRLVWSNTLLSTNDRWISTNESGEDWRQFLLGKVVLHPRPDVLPADPDVIVPVQPGLLVPQAQTVQELV